MIIDVDAMVEVVVTGPVRAPPVRLSFESVNNLIFDVVAARTIDVLVVASDSWVTPITLVLAEAMDVIGILVREAPDPLKSVARITLPATSVPVIVTLLRVALVNWSSTALPFTANATPLLYFEISIPAKGVLVPMPMLTVDAMTSLLIVS